ncbi:MULTISPECIES: MATE family efflux transporter [Roseobacteraceae]|uniref:MATE family efflux transporter n=1 Tax=Roseobacteraceae TaxID=2854170 RepID=UPI0013B782A8|nr:MULTISPECIES: MATE family efflux transporter [unclassified Salipiger]NDV49468.1 MATE family efflux transporter [Salipiger sp. PrR003]NDW32602.1 MATE family efflux transporter [Salipiger sp. PrR007]
MRSQNLPLTHGRVLKIALPILLSNATVPILGAVDTAVVGQIPSPEPIAAVGIGAVVLSAIYWIFGFLRMGTTGLTAQALGENDRCEVSALLARALLIGLAGGVLLIALQALIFRIAFAASPASQEVEQMAQSYMQIRIWSAPAAVAIYGLTGWLIAQERTRAVLVLQLGMNAVNVVLDLALVLWVGMGVEGVALATFVAEWSGLGLGLWLCRDGFAEAGWRNRARVFDPARLRRMAALNGDILIRSLLLEAIIVSFMLVGGRFGDETLAANQVLMQFMMITAHTMDGFAFAAEALVGQAVGARNLPHLRRSARLAGLWCVVAALLLAGLFWLVGPLLIRGIAADEAVRAAAIAFLPWMVVSPLLQALPFTLDGIFIGATRSADMRNMMAVSAVIYAAVLLLALPGMGNHGLWLAYQVSFLARGLTLALRYPALERWVAKGG